ncbi:MAG TPA: hypothetical protein VGU90_13345 [Terriglobales bacterium]|nr:hypothetical protein [Terriglobales bacterium]
MPASPSTRGAKPARRQRQSEPEPAPDTAELNGDKDYTVYADKQITPTMEAFADWLIDEVFEGDMPRGFDEDSFRKGVALGGSTRMDFQRSTFWAEDDRNRKNQVADVDEDDEVEQPRRRSGRQTRAAAAPAPVRSTRRSRRAEPEPEDDEVEPDEVEPDEDIVDEDDEVEPEPTPPPRRSTRSRRAKPVTAETEPEEKPAPARSTRRGRRAAAAAPAEEADDNPAAPY